MKNLINRMGRLRYLLLMMWPLLLTACQTIQFSGTVSGLTQEGLVLANGKDTVSVPANAATFSLSATLNQGSPYNLFVLVQPKHQTCHVANGSGTAGSAAVTNVVVTCDAVASAAMVSTVAGAGAAKNGPGNTASFYEPGGVAMDSAGNVYVADIKNGMIRKITPEGVVSTLAGSGPKKISTDGPGNTASFSSLLGVAVDSVGNVYVMDYNKIRKITPDGIVSTLAGTGQSGSTDGPGNTASFGYPGGVAVDSAGNIYVADSGNYKIRKITSGGIVSTLAGTGQSGSADGLGNVATSTGPKVLRWTVRVMSMWRT